MQFVVNELPYYQEECFFADQCPDAYSQDCPMVWDKRKVCDEIDGDQNPRECCLLIDFEKMTKEKKV